MFILINSGVKHKNFDSIVFCQLLYQSAYTTCVATMLAY